MRNQDGTERARAQDQSGSQDQSGHQSHLNLDLEKLREVLRQRVVLPPHKQSQLEIAQSASAGINQDLLEELLSSSNPDVQIAILRNQHIRIEPSQFESLLEDENPMVRVAAINRPEITPSLVSATLDREENPEVVKLMLYADTIPESILTDFSLIDEYQSVVAANSNLPTEVALELFSKNDPLLDRCIFRSTEDPEVARVLLDHIERVKSRYLITPDKDELSTSLQLHALPQGLCFIQRSTFERLKTRLENLQANENSDR